MNYILRFMYIIILFSVISCNNTNNEQGKANPGKPAETVKTSSHRTNITSTESCLAQIQKIDSSIRFQKNFTDLKDNDMHYVVFYDEQKNIVKLKYKLDFDKRPEKREGTEYYDSNGDVIFSSVQSRSKSKETIAGNLYYLKGGVECHGIKTDDAGQYGDIEGKHDRIEHKACLKQVKSLVKNRDMLSSKFSSEKSIDYNPVRFVRPGIKSPVNNLCTNVIVRESQDTSGKIIGYIQPQDDFRILEIGQKMKIGSYGESHWYQIITHSKKGWVYGVFFESPKYVLPITDIKENSIRIYVVDDNKCAMGNMFFWVGNDKTKHVISNELGIIHIDDIESESVDLVADFDSDLLPDKGRTGSDIIKEDERLIKIHKDISELYKGKKTPGEALHLTPGKVYYLIIKRKKFKMF